jgi:hypothetical protein
VSTTRYKPRAWAWLKAELAQRLGEEAMRELWAQHRRLARIDELQSKAQRYTFLIAQLERQGAHRSAETMREKQAKVRAQILLKEAALEEGTAEDGRD